jgi:hypothetical protein
MLVPCHHIAYQGLIIIIIITLHITVAAPVTELMSPAMLAVPGGIAPVLTWPC